VVVAGKSDGYIAIVRYTASGALDLTFSGDGKLKTNLGLLTPSLKKVVIQAGKIVAVGDTGGDNSDGLIVRYTPAGTLDTTFSVDGIATTNWGRTDTYISVVLDNSHLYVVGRSLSYTTAWRFIVAAYQP